MKILINQPINDYSSPIVSNGDSGPTPRGAVVPFILIGAVAANVFLVANANAVINGVVVANAVGAANAAINVNAAVNANALVDTTKVTVQNG